MSLFDLSPQFHRWLRAPQELAPGFQRKVRRLSHTFRTRSVDHSAPAATVESTSRVAQGEGGADIFGEPSMEDGEWFLSFKK